MTHEELVAVVARRIANLSGDWTDKRWAKAVSGYHDICAKFPEYANSIAPVPIAFRHARAAIAAIADARKGGDDEQP